jgi:hypothetical protein
MIHARRPIRRLLSASSVFAVSAFLSAVPGMAHAQSADPTFSDCLAANESSGHLQAEKKLRKARQEAAVCAAETCAAELHDTCRQRVVDLNKMIPTIVFVAKVKGADVLAVRVAMDGEVIAERLEGTAISVDPGQHNFHFETAGQAPVDRTIVLVEGEKGRVEKIEFASAAAEPPAPPPSVPPAVAPGQATPPPNVSASPTPPEAAPGTSAWRYVGYGALGVGGIGLAVGTVFGILAVSSNSQAHCVNHVCEAGPLSNAKSQATVANVGFIAGGILAAAGLGVIVFAPSGRSEASAVVTVAPIAANAGGAVLQGAW